MQPTQEEVSAVVKETLAEQVGVDHTLSPETHLLDDLEMDSLEVVELGVSLEKKLHVKLLNKQLRGCETVGELTGLVFTAVQRRESEESV